MHSLTPFDPAQGALPNGSSVAFLAQRDVQLNTPVNFCTYPGIALTAACFADGVYEADAAGTCISNLLVMGFRRMSVDLYWDVTQSLWSLCPVQLPRNLTGVLSTSSSVVASSIATTTSLGQTSVNARDVQATELAEKLVERLTDATPVNPTSTPSRTPTITSTPSSKPASTSATSLPSPLSFNGTLAEIGPYSCSPSLDISRLMEIMSGFLYDTETNLNATALILTLNIHAASPVSDPAGSARQPSADELPHGDSTLSSILEDTNSVYVFGPENLDAGRTDLNGSDGWYSDLVKVQDEPTPAFFQIEYGDGRYSTSDGWPSESYIILSRSKRLLAQFGTVDPQMAGYDFDADAPTIYSAGYLDAPRNVTTTSNGTITAGCFFNPGTTELENVNSSWATTVLGSGGNTPTSELQPLLAQAANLTACGISPILNSTLDGTTADRDYMPYLRFVRQTIWSWGPGQPLNSSVKISTATYRCAALNAVTGRWEAAVCDSRHHGACHNSTKPYVWEISSSRGGYKQVGNHCPANTTFDVPRNALENAYLLSAWRNHRTQSADDDDDSVDPLLWLDFNDLDVNACWVIGQNSSCPYQNPSPSITRRVVVSTVSGIIVFVLVGLLLLVKCAGNHQKAKRKRRRGSDGWDYEGVPS